MQPIDTYRSIAPFWPDPLSGLLPAERASTLLLTGRIQVAAIEATLRHQIEALKFLEERLDSSVGSIEDSQLADRMNDLFEARCSLWQDAFVNYFTKRSADCRDWVGGCEQDSKSHSPGRGLLPAQTTNLDGIALQ